MNSRHGRLKGARTLWAACLWTLASAAFAGSGVADVTEAEGGAWVKWAGEEGWEVAPRYAILNEGDEVKTDGKATLKFFFWPKKESVSLGGDSSVRIAKSGYQVLKGNATASKESPRSPKEEAQAGVTTLRGATEDLWRARNLWMQGRLDEAAGEYEKLLHGTVSVRAAARRHLAALRKAIEEEQELFSGLLERLSSKAGEPTEGVWRIALGRVSAGKTGKETAFAAHLQRQLRSAVERSEDFEEIPPGELGRAPDTPGDASGAADVAADASRLAKLGGVDALLAGTYVESPKGVRLSVEMLAAGSGKRLATADLDLPTETLALVEKSGPP